MSLMAIFDGVCKFLVVHVNINAATFRGPRLFACDRPAAAFPIRSYFDYELQLRAFAAFLNRVNSSSCSSNYLAATNYYSSLGSSNAEVRETRVSSTFSPLLCTLSNKNREKTAGGSRERERETGGEKNDNSVLPVTIFFRWLVSSSRRRVGDSPLEKVEARRIIHGLAYQGIEARL